MPARWKGAVAEAASLVDLLRQRSATQGSELAYRFVGDDGALPGQVSWSELDWRARGVAARLQALDLAGQRVLLLFPPCLDYVTAFFGCLYAGAVAVPAYPPHPRRPMPRIEAIVADCQPRAALTTSAVMASLRGRISEVPGLDALAWLAIDNADHSSSAGATADDWTDPAAQPQTLAFLQYTSGSTGDPKGVMVTHGNLLHNLEAIRQGFQMPERPVIVTWLPMYHDMGLIGGILEPMYLGGSVTMLSPAAFLQRPAAWLEAISEHRGSVNGAPNFAYDLCVERVTAEQRAELDLSCWEVAFCGAEPVRRQTLERFAEHFAPCGFRRDAFYPCYGLAEATLIVTGGSGPGPVAALSIDKAGLERGQARPVPQNHPDAHELVSCGRALGEQLVAIVDPQTLTRTPPGEIGEVWIAGPSVAAGYWKRPELSAEVFGARLADSLEGPFLRTGDLGFLHDGELYVTGRIKDLIIIRGQNHYPQDIERTVDDAHPALRSGGGAAFAIERHGEERLVVVHEVRRDWLRELNSPARLEEVVDAIRLAVAQEHQLALDAVVLLQPGQLPKTSSGKTQRRACRADYLADRLKVVAVPTERTAPGDRPAAANGQASAPAPSPPSAAPAALSAASAQQWLVAWLARKLSTETRSIDPDRSVATYGLDSLAAMELVRDVEEQLGRKLNPDLLWDFPTLAALAGHLAGEGAAVETAAAEPPAALPPPRRRWWPLPRWDGYPLEDEDPTRRIQPYIMPRRSDCLAYFEATYDVSRTLAWLEAYNRAGPRQPATFFDLFLWAVAHTAHRRPGLNRFVSGGRTYQRNHVAISFMAKRTFELDAPFLTIKVEFPPHEPFAATAQRVATAVAEGRSGAPRAVDRELAVITRLPAPLIRLLVAAYRTLDRWNLLPAALTRNDPMYVTVFVSNLGSIGLDATYHHLFEIGTCSVFAALGVQKAMPAVGPEGRLEVRQRVPVKWTIDTRIVDGFYAAACLQTVRTVIEDIERFLGPPETAARGDAPQAAP